MRRQILLGLAGLGLVQMLLIIWMWWPRASTHADLRAVLSFSATEIEEIQISGAGIDGTPKKPVRLALDGDNWAIASLDGFPARNDRVAALVKQLAGLKVRAPISSDPKQHDSLGVAENRFSRKISLRTAAETATFFVGQGKGNSVHIRVEGSDDVYLTHGTTAWRLSADQADYVERIYFQFDTRSLSAIRITSPVDQYELTITDGRFSSPLLLPGQQIKQDVLTHAVGKLAQMVTRKALGANEHPEFGMDTGTSITLVLETDVGGVVERTIRVGRPNGALVPIKAQHDRFYVLTSLSNVRGFVGSRLQDFLTGPPQEP